MRLLLIFNPHAASGRAARLLPKIRLSLEQFSELEICLTQYPGHASDWVAAADLARFDGVLAAGGDGTLFEVLNGMYRHLAHDRAPLGLIPVGTGNAFARELGLAAGDWEKGVSIIQAGNLQNLDVGRVQSGSDTFYFLNITGLGFPVDAMKTAKKLKAIGPAAYSIAVLREILRLKSYHLSIELDGEKIEQENIFIEVSNTRYTGTSFLIAPAAKMNDGMLDVTLLRNLSRWRLLRLFPTIFSGKHLVFTEVSTYQARTIRILAPENQAMVTDGELRGSSPVSVTCLAGDVKFFSP